MIRAGHWLAAATVALAIHGGLLGLAMSSPEVAMERSAGRPGAVWGLPVETIADVVDPSEASAAEPVDTAETVEAETAEPEPVEAETVETPDVPEAVDVAAVPVPEPLETPSAETPPTEPLEETPTTAAWDGWLTVMPETTEAVEPMEAASEVQVAALTPVEQTEPLEAQDVTIPVPPVRPKDVPRVEAPPQTKTKTQAKPKSVSAKKTQSASANASARATGRQASAAAPAGEQVGSGGRKASDGGRHLVSSYAGRVAAHLQRHKRYPKEAAANNLSGTATITFTIGTDGRVRASRVSRGSGAGVLDREVVAMVDRAAPFPPIPKAIGKSTMTFTVPVRFQPR